MAEIIAKRYAKALFDLTLEQNLVDEYDEVAKMLINVLAKDDDLSGFLKNPQISRNGKLALIQSALKGNVPDDFIGLMTIVLGKKRENLLSMIFVEFTERVKKHKNIAEATVTSAFPLTEKQLNDINETLSRKLNKKILIKQQIDTSIIAGFKVTVAGLLFDATAKTRIRDIKNVLLNREARV